MRSDPSNDWFEARESARSELLGRGAKPSTRRSRRAQRDANAWHHREAGFMADPVDAVVMQ